MQIQRNSTVRLFTKFYSSETMSVKEISSKKQLAFFQNKVFCISNNNVEDEDDKKESKNSSSSAKKSSSALSGSYILYKKMTEALGGKVSGTMHKKVDFLFASDFAVSGATQKVRKAVKLCVPMLRMDFLIYCFDHKRPPVNQTEFIIQDSRVANKTLANTEEGAAAAADSSGTQKKTKKDKKKKKKRSASEADLDEDADSAAPYKYAVPSFISNIIVECGCICHDQGKDSCEWCVAAHIANETNQQQQKVEEGVNDRRGAKAVSSST